jgi:hypothetical protein
MPKISIVFGLEFLNLIGIGLKVISKILKEILAKNQYQRRFNSKNKNKYSFIHTLKKKTVFFSRSGIKPLRLEQLAK